MSPASSSTNARTYIHMWVTGGARVVDMRNIFLSSPPIYETSACLRGKEEDSADHGSGAQEGEREEKGGDRKKKRKRLKLQSAYFEIPSCPVPNQHVDLPYCSYLAVSTLSWTVGAGKARSNSVHNPIPPISLFLSVSLTLSLSLSLMSSEQSRPPGGKRWHSHLRMQARYETGQGR